MAVGQAAVISRLRALVGDIEAFVLEYRRISLISGASAP
jgi:hypothetical protein